MEVAPTQVVRRIDEGYTAAVLSLGEQVRVARERRGLTQEELGKKCDVNKQTIHRIEIGQQRPRKNTLKKLQDVFGASVALQYPHGSQPEQEDPHAHTRPKVSDVLRVLTAYISGLDRKERHDFVRLLAALFKAIDTSEGHGPLGPSRDDER